MLQQGTGPGALTLGSTPGGHPSPALPSSPLRIAPLGIPNSIAQAAGLTQHATHSHASSPHAMSGTRQSPRATSMFGGSLTVATGATQPLHAAKLVEHTWRQTRRFLLEDMRVTPFEPKGLQDAALQHALQQYIGQLLDARRLGIIAACTPANAHSMYQGSLAVTQGARGAPSPSGPRNLGLRFTHICLGLACNDADCGLCKHNPSKRCKAKEHFCEKYLEQDQMSTRCGAELAVEFYDVDTEQTVAAPEAVVGKQIEVLVINGAKAPDGKLPSSYNFEDAQQVLLSHTDGQPLLVPGPGGRHNDRQGVVVELQAGKGQQLPRIAITKSSESLLSGRKATFRLVARLLTEGETSEPIRNTLPAVSQAFVVATRRVKGNLKNDIPFVDEPLVKLDGIGRQTAEKLADLPSAAKKAGWQLELPAFLREQNKRGVSTVGELRELMQDAEKAESTDMKTALLSILKLNAEQWAKTLKRVSGAVDRDNRVRKWVVGGRGPLGTPRATSDPCLAVIFDCKQGKLVFDRPLGLLLAEGAHPDKQEAIITPWDELNSEQREMMEQLKERALEAWNLQRHPGWESCSIDADQLEKQGHKLTGRDAGVSTRVASRPGTPYSSDMRVQANPLAPPPTANGSVTQESHMMQQYSTKMLQTPGNGALGAFGTLQGALQGALQPPQGAAAIAPALPMIQTRPPSGLQAGSNTRETSQQSSGTLPPQSQSGLHDNHLPQQLPHQFPSLLPSLTALLPSMGSLQGAGAGGDGPLPLGTAGPLPNFASGLESMLQQLPSLGQNSINSSGLDALLHTLTQIPSLPSQQPGLGGPQQQVPPKVPSVPQGPTWGSQWTVLQQTAAPGTSALGHMNTAATVNTPANVGAAPPAMERSNTATPPAIPVPSPAPNPSPTPPQLQQQLAAVPLLAAPSSAPMAAVKVETLTTAQLDSIPMVTIPGGGVASNLSLSALLGNPAEPVPLTSDLHGASISLMQLPSLPSALNGLLSGSGAQPAGPPRAQGSAGTLAPGGAQQGLKPMRFGTEGSLYADILKARGAATGSGVGSREEEGHGEAPPPEKRQRI